MNIPKIIAICGAKRSGKDTLARIISEEYGFEHVKISQKLKDVCKILFNLNDDQIENDSKEQIDVRWGITPRKIMQFMGTEMMQYKLQEILPSVGKKFWINSLLETMKDDKRYVISDLRFLHEYHEIRKKGGIIVRIEDLSLTDNDSHISENEFKEIPCDLVIDNTEKNMSNLRQKFADYYSNATVL